MNSLSKEKCEQLIFVGEILGPFYLEDPKTGKAAAAFEAFKTLDIDDAAVNWPFVSVGDVGAVSELLEAMRLMKVGLSDGVQSEDLIWEYRRLFVGPAVRPAPPWGSVYTDRDCVVFGKSTLDLRQWMRECGITRQSDEDTPEDHIGLMLLLLSWLAENKPNLVCDYLRLHLLTWSSHFLDLLIAASKQSFYEGLARLTKLSLEGIAQELDLQVEYPRFYR